MKVPQSAIEFQDRDWTKITVETIADGIQRQMIWGDRLTVCRLRIAPHTVTAVHTHPHEQMTIVVRGRVLFTIEDEQRVVSAGDVLHFPSNVAHGATMLEEEVVLIDVFSPVREDFLPPGAAKPASEPGDLFRLDGKVALVTGASRGLGAAMAIALAGAGADVALHASEQPSSATEARICASSGRRTHLLTADLEDPTSADRIIADTLAQFSRIDILVNNAGIIRRQLAADHTDEYWNSVI